jgi:xanthine dehydrogenase YagS FAD-binding subunit
MRPFDYVRPTTLDETIELLTESADGVTQPLAGGTDLLTLMKADIAAPARLADVKQLDGLSDQIRETADGVTLGALTTLADMETSALLQERYPLLSESAAVAATPQLRNMATLGGNLLQRPRCWYFRDALFHCWLKGGEECFAREGRNQFHALFGDSPCCAVHPSDSASALLAADARVRLRGSAGERTLALADFFAPPTEERRREHVLGDDELLLAVEVDALPAGARSTYLKAMDRKVWAFALVGVAAVVHLANGTIDHVRLVLSGVAPVPWRAHAAEQELLGGPPSAERIERAAEAALAEAKPLQHNGYKIPLARQLLRRSLTTLTAEADAQG